MPGYCRGWEGLHIILRSSCLWITSVAVFSKCSRKHYTSTKSMLTARSWRRSEYRAIRKCVFSRNYPIEVVENQTKMHLWLFWFMMISLKNEDVRYWQLSDYIHCAYTQKTTNSLTADVSCCQYNISNYNVSTRLVVSTLSQCLIIFGLITADTKDVNVVECNLLCQRKSNGLYVYMKHSVPCLCSIQCNDQVKASKCCSTVKCMSSERN